MGKFGPKENVMSGEKTKKHCYIDDFGYCMFGLGYGWLHVIMYAGYKTDDHS